MGFFSRPDAERFVPSPPFAPVDFILVRGAPVVGVGRLYFAAGLCVSGFHVANEPVGLIVHSIFRMH